MFSSVACNQKQTFVIFRNTVFTCGDNDNGELSRRGKCNVLQRVDALEACCIENASMGDSFFLLTARDSSKIGWGRNDMGQLGSADRDS